MSWLGPSGRADAVVQIGGWHWLRIPLGKLRNDRYVPLHPELVSLLAAWTAGNLDHIRRHKRLITDHRGPLDRYLIGRVTASAAPPAVPGVHPHQLRHTLATQAINRGMRLEAIAALLGHRSMEMTLTYARIADRVVADEYAYVSAKIIALYGQPLQLPADYETTAHGLAAPRSPRPDARQRTVHGPPSWTSPPGIRLRDLRLLPQFGTEFLPILVRQRDHARDRALPTGPPCSTASSSAPKPDPPPPNGADRHARHHPRPQRRRRTRRDAHLSSPTG